MRRAVVFSALVLLLAAAAPSAGAATPSAVGADRALDRALRGLVGAKEGPPGAIAIVQRGGRVKVHSAGFANVASRAGIRPRDRMRIASASKAFSGAAALALVAKGHLGLEDTIGATLPGLPAAWDDVTLWQLLTHRSGLPEYAATPAFGEALTASPKLAPAPAVLLSYVADAPLRFPPGSEYRYSNTDNIVAALMVEEATRKSYRAALRDLVFDPLRLRRSSLPVGASLPAGHIHGYGRGEDGKLEDVSEEVAFGGWAWASGGIVSAPADLNSFIRAYVGGRLLGKGVRRAQFRFGHGHSEPPGPGRNSAGPALFRYRTRCGTVFGHTGSILGYTQLMAATANGKRSVTFSINTQVTDSLLPKLRRAQVTAVCAALAR